MPPGFKNGKPIFSSGGKPSFGCGATCEGVIVGASYAVVTVSPYVVRLFATVEPPEGCSVDSVSWDFGDLSTPGTSLSVTHTYSSIGTSYTAVLTVTLDCGGDIVVCTATVIVDFADYGVGCYAAGRRPTYIDCSMFGWGGPFLDGLTNSPTLVCTAEIGHICEAGNRDWTSTFSYHSSPVTVYNDVSDNICTNTRRDSGLIQARQESYQVGVGIVCLNIPGTSTKATWLSMNFYPLSYGGSGTGQTIRSDYYPADYDWVGKVVSAYHKNTPSSECTSFGEGIATTSGVANVTP